MKLNLLKIGIQLFIIINRIFVSTAPTTSFLSSLLNNLFQTLLYPLRNNLLRVQIHHLLRVHLQHHLFTDEFTKTKLGIGLFKLYIIFNSTTKTCIILTNSYFLIKSILISKIENEILINNKMNVIAIIK